MNTITFKDKTITPSKIICVGKNFADHAREMGDENLPKEPVIFLKPNSALVHNPKKINIPSSLGLLHHEVELSFLIGKECQISAYAVGIDFTLRDKQKAFKAKGHPWELSKGFDGSAVFGEFAELSDSNDLDISLKLNGDMRQNSNTKNMIFFPEKIMSFVSTYMTLNPGDIVMCGTPSGVGPVENGDTIEAKIENLPELKFTVNRN